MRLTVIAAYVAAAVVGGCAAAPPMESFGQEYANADHGPVDIGTSLSETYEVWIHPVKSKVMVQPAFRSAMNISIRQGLTLGLGDSVPTRDRFERAAAALLGQRNGRGCSLGNPVEIRSAVWEFDYDCPPTSAPATSAKRR